MQAAVLVVDMLVDSLKTDKHGGIHAEGMAIVPRLQGFLSACRRQGLRVVYANDSFLPEDRLFRGRIRPHAIRGTPGAAVIEDIAPMPEDAVVPKRRFSAFFKTDLDQTLRTWNVDTVAICGITTPICVLATALDAIAHDFDAVVLSDATAAHKPQVHEDCLQLYRRTALAPLLRVQETEEFLADVAHHRR